MGSSTIIKMLTLHSLINKTPGVQPTLPCLSAFEGGDQHHRLLAWVWIPPISRGAIEYMRTPAFYPSMSKAVTKVEQERKLWEKNKHTQSQRLCTGLLLRTGSKTHFISERTALMAFVMVLCLWTPTGASRVRGPVSQRYSPHACNRSSMWPDPTPVAPQKYRAT